MGQENQNEQVVKGYDDDIYYNPKKEQDTSEEVSNVTTPPTQEQTAQEALNGLRQTGAESASPQEETNGLDDDKYFGLSEEDYNLLRAKEVEGLDSRIATTKDFIDKLKIESEADEKKRKKREKARRIISAVGDGLTALSNVIFTKNYAPDMYEPRYSMYDAVDKNIERAKAERDKNKDLHYKYSMMLGDLEDKKGRRLRDLDDHLARMQQRRQAAKDAAQKAKWKAEDREDEKRKKKADAELAERRADEAKAKADNAPELWKNKAENEKKRGGVLDSTKNKNDRTGTGKSKSSSHSGGGGYDTVVTTETYDSNDNLVKKTVKRKNDNKGAKPSGNKNSAKSGFSIFK